MRFIKKSNYKDLLSLSKTYKEFELFLSGNDLNDKETVLTEAKRAFDEHGAIITSIHCPESQYKTSLGDSCVNYMSWGEVISTDLDRNRFFSVCELAEALAKYYGSKEIKDINISEEDDDHEDKEYAENEDNENNGCQTDAPEFDTKVIVIFHMGCQKGCGDTSIFPCPFKNSDMNKCCGKDVNDNLNENDILKKLCEFKNIIIAFENITPYSDGKSLYRNSGYRHENFELAERLNSFAEKLNNRKDKLFGTVVDICHIFASHKILTQCDQYNTETRDPIEYFNEYISGAVSGKRKDLICLLHLSKYNNDGTHGGNFDLKNEEDLNILNAIWEWCRNFGLSIPVTLELSGSENIKDGSKNFFDFVLNWSKLHIFLNKKTLGKLYGLFEKMFEFYSMDITQNNEKEAYEKAESIAKDVARELAGNSISEISEKLANDIAGIFKQEASLGDYLYIQGDKHLGHNLDGNLLKFAEFAAEKIKKSTADELEKYRSEDIMKFSAEHTNVKPVFAVEKADIYLLQVRAYIIYMRFCGLAFDLKKKYSGLDIDIPAVLWHYMFNDRLGELRFDGLGTFYDIYWVKNRMTLFHCCDGYEGNPDPQKGSFTELIKSCFQHITDPSLGENYMSFSKAFGRVMFKYFNPNLVGKFRYKNSNEQREYNLMVLENAPINYIKSVDGKQLTLQEFQDKPCMYDNFSIDLSDFYNNRGDTGVENNKKKDPKDASLLKLFEKVTSGTEELFVSNVGSIYDEEVIFKNIFDFPENAGSGTDPILHIYNLSNFEYEVMMRAYLIQCRTSQKIDFLKILSGIPNINTPKIVEILNFIDYDREKKIKICFGRKYNKGSGGNYDTEETLWDDFPRECANCSADDLKEKLDELKKGCI